MRNHPRLIERKFWAVLKLNEPTVIELTKGEYENYRSAQQVGRGGEHDTDVPASVGEDTAQKVSAPIPRKGFKANADGKGTKAQIVETLKQRGLTTAELRGLNRKELVDLL